MNPSALHEAFAARFGRRSDVVARAPGRVNIIGEHTDYNDGFVLPIAIEQRLWAAAAMREDGVLRAASDALGDEQEWPIKLGPARDQSAWTRYVGGVAALLSARGVQLTGADLFIAGDLPVGGGLSSSAAIEVSTALALCGLAGYEIPPLELAALCQRAEHEYAGVPSGIMDQFASILSRAGTAMLLDCRSREIEFVPCELREHRLLVVDSGVRHELAAGEYAKRRRQCERVVELVRTRRSDVMALRDLTPEDLKRIAADEALGSAAGKDWPVLLARARHVVSENERTLAAAGAMRRHDWPELGRLMSASHISLRDDYQVSCRELDDLVDLLLDGPGVLGARMTGGGFGGSVVALVEQKRQDAVIDRLKQGRGAAPRSPAHLWVQPGPGAQFWSAT